MQVGRALSATVFVSLPSRCHDGQLLGLEFEVLEMSWLTKRIAFVFDFLFWLSSESFVAFAFFVYRYISKSEVPKSVERYIKSRLSREKTSAFSQFWKAYPIVLFPFAGFYFIAFLSAVSRVFTIGEVQ